MKHRYSPLAMKDYSLPTLAKDELSVIEMDARCVSIWNLYWLSTPTIDFVPGSGKNWYKKHSPILGALGGMIRDVHDDEVLFSKLKMHPQSFLDWWEREDHTVYDTYDVLGAAWPGTVLSRAQEAADRRFVEAPLVERAGNVIRVNFKRAA